MSKPFIPVISSLLETDLYKFTMWQAMLHRHPAAQARYEFLCRNQAEFPLAHLAPELERQLDHLCSLSFTQDELDYLSSLRYIKSDFVDFLSLFRYQRRFIKVETEGPTLRIITEGPQVHIMGFEIVVLAIVNELYFRQYDPDTLLTEGRKRLAAKVAQLKSFAQEPQELFGFDLSDFGLRRRYSAAWHDEVIATLAREVPEYFKGTSNVYLARKHNLVPIGTMAHEYFQSFQAFGAVRLRDFQKAALEDWVQEYRGDLGIALTDTIGMKAFLRDFDLYFAKLFDGLRHDSGDPYEWGELAIEHYKNLRIDPRSKRLVFSDGLNIDTAIALYRYFGSRIQVGFGIGTSLTNDMGVEALNIVMKLVSCNGATTAKLSDSPGKMMCDDETFIAYLRQVFNHYH